MRTIYLDIDGVLCVRSPDGLSIAQGNFQVPHPDCVANLNAIVDNTDAEIVISSSWRKVYRVEYIKNWFKRYDIHGNIIGTTEKEDIKGVPRGQQILNAYKKWRYGKFLIIDDESNAFEGLKDNLDYFPIHTDFNVGITKNHARLGIKYLLGKEFKDFIKKANFVERGI